MTDELQTTPFPQFLRDVPNRAQVATIATMATIRSAGIDPDETAGDPLPRVDHLMALGEVLGVGGNGEVVAAEQPSLRRSIAVKRPHAGANMAARLLREARVIGFLEHPNIPPVHFVGSGANDQLLVGLKRIEGETLTDRLARERPGQNLEENLDILVHICNAVGYAHSRGILHLDLKPDNVMTGHYGEVYVLDWGLAVAFREELTPGIPHARANGGVRGTPAFLAPEMITSGPLDAATDVYLLGGLLHYILTHEPPNGGATAIDALQSAYEPRPRTYGADVPRTLADICRKALAHDPRDRYADADEFRVALIEYRRMRGELEAIGVAELQTARLDAALAESDPDPAAVYQRYGATRQAIDEVARLGGNDGAAGPLLQSALELLIRWELRRDNVGGAELLLTELPEPNAELTAACDALHAARSSAAAELQALRLEADPNVGRAGKVLLVAACGVVIALGELIPYLLGIAPTAQRVLGGYVVYLTIVAITTIAARKTLFRTRINRGSTLAVWQLNAFGLAVRIGAYVGAISLPAAVGYDLTLVCLVNIYAALTFDLRIGLSLPIYVLAASLCFMRPELALLTFGIAHFFGLTTIGLAIAYLPTRRTSKPAS